MRIMRAITVAACALTISGASAGVALAGEITGNGKSLKTGEHSVQGASICAFSGLNDTYSGDPEVPDAQGFYRTQNWGQVSREFRAILSGMGEHPGRVCKPQP